MADDPRPHVMTPGRCTFCGGPAMRGPSGAWWHLDQSCRHPGLARLPAYAVPEGPLGPSGQWPPRFEPGPHPTSQPEEI